MSETKNSGNKELLKYPILVLSIILGVVVLDLFDYNIVSLGASGIEVERRIENSLQDSEAMSQKIDSLELLLSELVIKLENQPTTKSTGEQTYGDSINDSPLAGSAVKKGKAWTHQLQASDLTTKIHQELDQFKKSEVRTGWIWIGCYYSPAWDPMNLKGIGEKVLYSGAPEGIQKNDVYEVVDNMYMREHLPPNNEQYFRSVEWVGIVPSGTKVEVIEPPRGLERNSSIHYWMKIKY